MGPDCRSRLGMGEDLLLEKGRRWRWVSAVGSGRFPWPLGHSVLLLIQEWGQLLQAPLFVHFGRFFLYFPIFHSFCSAVSGGDGVTLLSVVKSATRQSIHGHIFGGKATAWVVFF